MLSTLTTHTNITSANAFVDGPMAQDEALYALLFESSRAASEAQAAAWAANPVVGWQASSGYLDRL